MGIQIYSFYNEVSFGARQLIDTSTGKSIDHKTPLKVYDLVKQIAMNSYTWGGQRGKLKMPGVHNVDSISATKQD